MHVNKVIVSGRLASDPATSFTEKGGQVVSFSLMAEELGPGDQVFRTYVPCMAYGKSAEKVGDLSKGDTVLIDGRLSWRKATEEKLGRIEVFCTNVEIEKASRPAFVTAQSEN